MEKFQKLTSIDDEAIKKLFNPIFSRFLCISFQRAK